MVQAHPMSSTRYVLKAILTHHLFHLVLEVKLEFFQTMLFDLFLGGKSVLTFEDVHQPVILMVLVKQIAVTLIRLHQVRFDLFLTVPVHSGHLSSSGVASPCRMGTLT